MGSKRVADPIQLALLNPPFLQRKNVLFGTSILHRFWGRLGRHFDSILNPFWLPDRSWTPWASQTSISWETYKNNNKINKNASPAPPKTNQNPPKSLPRGNFFAPKFRPHFWIDLGLGGNPVGGRGVGHPLYFPYGSTIDFEEIECYIL